MTDRQTFFNVSQWEKSPKKQSSVVINLSIYSSNIHEYLDLSIGVLRVDFQITCVGSI